MSKKRILSNNWQPVTFNASRISSDRQEQEWLSALLENGRLVASPSELGMLAWVRADRALSSKIELMSEHIAPSSWVLGVSERTDAASMWSEQSWSPQLERTLNVFWPGPLFVQNLASEANREIFASVWGRKLPLWMPHSGLCTTLLKICKFPLACGVFRWDKGIFPPTASAIVDKVGSDLEVVLEGRDRPGRLVPSLLDTSSACWRLVRRGSISAKQLSDFSGKHIMLSGEAHDAQIGARASVVRLIVFEGEPERVVRRMRAFVEGLESDVSVHYFLHSECALSAFAAEKQVHRPLGTRHAESIANALEWQKLALETWDGICSLNEPQDAVVLLEGVPRNECTEEFMERMTRSAYHVINMMSTDD